jgi:hypothetical protein
LTPGFFGLGAARVQKNMNDFGQAQIPDGVILDVFSEYVYASRSEALSLLKNNEAGCTDAVMKILTMIALAPQIGVSFRMNSSNGMKLANELSDANRLVTIPVLSDQERSKIRPEARQWVLNAWDSIDSAIAGNRNGIRDAWAGVARREFQLYFGNADPHWTHDHYEEIAAKQLSRSSLIPLSSALNVVREHINVPDELVEDWLNCIVITHYRNLRECWMLFPTDYVPAQTRSSLLVSMWEDSVGQRDWDVFSDVLPCIAYDILSHAHSRKDLIPAALHWSNEPRGQHIRQGFRELRANYNFWSDEKRLEELSKIRKILEAPGGITAQITVTLLAAVKVRLPVETPYLNTPRGLLWLWDINRPYVLQDVRNALYALLSMN